MRIAIQNLFKLLKICLKRNWIFLVRMRKDAEKGVYLGCEVHEKHAVTRRMHYSENTGRVTNKSCKNNGANKPTFFAKMVAKCNWCYNNTNKLKITR